MCMCKFRSTFFIYIAAWATVVISGCVTTGGMRIDNVPMYGQPAIERPEVMKRADEEFIKQASDLGGREKASVAWWVQGDKFMNEGNLDYAMRRYNQSWLLNPNSFRPYWGFGRVLLERGEVDQSLKYLEKAVQLVDDQYQKVALLADTATVYSVKANQIIVSNPKEGARYFALANQYYEESTKLDANYPNSWRSWARSLYFEGRFAEAWEKVKTARSLGAPEFPIQFIKDLEAKMPQPK